MDEIKKNERVIYTALFGDYDDLLDPKEKYKGCDFVCFTDQEDLKSNTWEIRLIKEIDLPLNMMNRRYKILPHLFLSEYKQSLYIDANIRILSNPLVLFDKYLTTNLIAAPNHGRRDCIYEEAIKCIEVGKVKIDEVLPQMKEYKSQQYPKHNGLLEMNIIFRNHNNLLVQQVMNDWWTELNKYTQRDQLSFCYTVWKHAISVTVIDESSRQKNKYFFAECHKNDPSWNKFKRYIKRKILV